MLVAQIRTSPPKAGPVLIAAAPAAAEARLAAVVEHSPAAQRTGRAKYGVLATPMALEGELAMMPRNAALPKTSPRNWKPACTKEIAMTD